MTESSSDAESDRIRLLPGSNASSPKSSKNRVITDKLRVGQVKVDPAMVKKLAKAGTIDDDWENILTALANHKPSASGQILYPDTVADHHYFADVGAGVLLIVDSDDIVEFRRNIAVTQFVGELLGPFHAYSGAPPALASIDLSADGLSTLLGLTDAARTSLAASLVQRHPLKGIVVNSRDVSEQLKQGKATKDNRWLAVVASKAGISFPRGKTDIEKKGLIELQGAGLVVKLPKLKDHWIALMPAVDLANRMMNATPSLILSAGTSGLKDGLAEKWILVGGWSLLRIACGGAENKDRYVVSGIDGLAATAELTAYIAACCGIDLTSPKKSTKSKREPAKAVKSKTRPDSMTAKPKIQRSIEQTAVPFHQMDSAPENKANEFRSCPECYNPIKPGQDTCSRCQAKISPQVDTKSVIKLCASCGEEISSSNKFCTSCSNSIVKLQDQKTVFCGQCGIELLPSKKFCTDCGAVRL